MWEGRKKELPSPGICHDVLHDSRLIGSVRAFNVMAKHWWAVQSKHYEWLMCYGDAHGGECAHCPDGRSDWSGFSE